MHLPDQGRVQANGAAAGGVLSKYRYYVLALLASSNILNYLDRNIISILAEHIKADLHVTDAFLGFLYGTAFAACYAVFAIPMGRLADRWRRGRLLGIGLFLWSGMTMVTGLASSFAQLAVARLFIGIGEATSAPTCQSLIPDFFPKHSRGGAMGIYLSGIAIGGGAALLLGGFILQTWQKACGDHCAIAGWRVTFLVLGAPGLLLALLIATMREPVRGGMDGLAVDAPHTKTPLRVFLTELATVLPPLTSFHMFALGGLRPALINAAFGVVLAGAATALILTLGDWAQWIAFAFGIYAIFSLFQSLSIRDIPMFRMTAGSVTFVSLIVGVAMLTCMVTGVSFWSVPYAMRTFGLSPGKAGLLFGLSTACCAAAGTVLGGFLVDRWRRTDLRGAVWIGFICLVVVVPSVLAMYLGHNFAMFFAGYVLISLVHSSFSPGVALQVQELVLPRMRAQAAALYGLSVTLFQFAVGPYLVGKVSTMTGSLSTGVLAILAFAPLSAAGLWVCSRHVRRAEEDRVQIARVAGEPG